MKTIIPVSWGHPRWGVDTGYWEIDLDVNDDLIELYKEEHGEYADNAREFVSWLEYTKGAKRVDLRSVHFNRKGGGGPSTGIDTGPVYAI